MCGPQQKPGRARAQAQAENRERRQQGPQRGWPSFAVAVCAVSIAVAVCVVSTTAVTMSTVRRVAAMRHSQHGLGEQTDEAD